MVVEDSTKSFLSPCYTIGNCEGIECYDERMKKAHATVLRVGLCLFNITMDKHCCDFREDRKNDHEYKHDNRIRDNTLDDFVDGIFLV